MTEKLILKVLNGEKVPSTPVWFMRQAGRYLPEYRKLREKFNNFMDFCKNPEAACEATLQPIRRFNLDAAIIFSDILTIPDAMGLKVEFVPNFGPKFSQKISNIADIEKLIIPDEEQLNYVFQAIKLARGELDDNTALIGFSGSPWTLATYMLEGQGSRDHRISKAFIYQNKEARELLLEKLTVTITNYLTKQVENGAEIVMIFDSWGGSLAHWNYYEFSLKYMEKIAQQLQNVPVILFSKGAGIWLEEYKNTKARAVGLDWTISLSQARKILGEKIVLQGNLDPSVLLTDKNTIQKEVKRVLADYGNGHRHIFNLGHGISPDVKPENVAIMLDIIREESLQYHL